MKIRQEDIDAFNEQPEEFKERFLLLFGNTLLTNERTGYRVVFKKPKEEKDKNKEEGKKKKEFDISVIDRIEFTQKVRVNEGDANTINRFFDGLQEISTILARLGILFGRLGGSEEEGEEGMPFQEKPPEIMFG